MLHQGISPPDTRGDSTVLNPAEEICGVLLRPCSEDGQQAPNDSQDASDNEPIPPPYKGDQESNDPGSDNSDGFISRRPGKTVISTGFSSCSSSLSPPSSSDSPAETSPSQPTESPHLGTITLSTQMPITKTIVVTGLGPDMEDEKGTSTPSFVRADGPPGLVTPTPVPSLVESSDTQRSQEASPLLACLYIGLMMSLAAALISPEAIVSLVALILLTILMRDRL